MGLATSQARLLMLTTQLNNIDAHLAMDSDALMGLSRESSAASKEYANALNQKKIVDSNTEADVTYNSLMAYNPNSASQYVLTNANGYVVLSDSYLSGVSGNSGTAKDLTGGIDDPYAFAAKMMGNKYSATDIKTASEAYESTKKTSSGTSTNLSMVGSEYTYNIRDILASDWRTNYESGTAITLDSATDNGNQYDYYRSSSADANNNLGTKDHQATTDAALTADIANLASSVQGNLINVNSKYSAQVKAAVAYAETATYNKFVYNVDDNDSTDNSDGVGTSSVSYNKIGNNDYYNNGDLANNLTRTSSGSNRIVSGAECNHYTGKYAHSNAYNYVNTTQLVNTFFGYFDQYLNQNYGGWTSSQWSQSPTNDNVGAASTTAKVTGGIAVNPALTPIPTTPTTPAGSVPVDEAEYYIKLYRSIENQGWSRSDNIDKSSAYLQQKLENGSVYINSVSTSGKLSNIALDSDDSPVSEEDDKDAQAKAEAEYQAKKDEINYKENYYNTDQTNTDTQRQEVETSIESTKKVLDTNIQKFKIFTA